MPHRKRFIVFEGIDGCGKGTQIHLLEELLKANDYHVLATKEPTEGYVGQKIRQVLRGEISKPSAEELQCVWYTQDRQQHQEEIRRFLGERRLVLCDRYYHSTIAYGVADGVPFGKLWSANKQFLRPGLTLWLSIPPIEALKRIDNSRSRELFEGDLKFQERVHRQYELMASNPEFNEIVTIDARPKPEKVVLVIQKVVAEHLRRTRHYSRQVG